MFHTPAPINAARKMSNIRKGSASQASVTRITTWSIRGVLVHNLSLQAAALAYYTLFSIVPVLVVVLWALKLFHLIPYLKAAGEENWPLMQRAIDLIRQARTDGMDVTADIYPYIRNGLGLGSLIHPRHYARGAAVFLKTLGDQKIRQDLRREIETTGDWENWYRHVGSNWDNVLVARVPERGDKKFEGKSIAEIAKLRGKDEWATFFDLVESGEVSVNPKSMNEEQKYLALRTEFISFCTDSEPIDLATATSAHPRGFGSFPRVLAKYVREEKIITLEMAIRKMTSLPANRLKLFDRGRIAPGMAADLVVFDPNTIQDTATFSKPLAFPTGISRPPLSWSRR